MLVVFGTVRSSPGVTTTALGVASCIEDAIAIEADPDGGILAARYGLERDPNLASLAAVARTALTRDVLGEHSQVLPGGVRVIVGLASPERAVTLWRSVGQRIAFALGSVEDASIVVDAGRLTPTSPLVPLVEVASLTVLVARPTPEDLHPLAHRLETLRSQARELALVLVGDKPYGPGEVGERLGIAVLGVIAHDPKAASALAGVSGATGGGWLRRSPLARSTRTVAQALLERCDRPEPSRRLEELASP